MTRPVRGPAGRVCNAFDDLRSGTRSVTTTAVALATANAPGTSIMEVIIQNAPGSAGNLLVGDSRRQDFVLATTSAPLTLKVNDLSKVYVKAVTTATVNWIAFT